MKRILASILLLLCILVSLHAWDFGLDISNTTVYTCTDTWNLIQSNRALLWVSLPLAESVRLYISGYYDFYGFFSDVLTEINPGRFDAGLSYIAFKPQLERMILTLKAGRLQTADAVNSIYSGYFDGLALSIATGNSKIDLEAGYFGLLYKKEAMILIDADDTAGYIDDDVYLSEPRMLAMLAYSVDDLLQGFDIGFEVWSQFDLAPDGTATHSLYYEPRAHWRIGSYFTLSSFGILSMLVTEQIQLGYAYGAEFSARIPSFFRAAVSCRLYTSGGMRGEFISYAPIRLSSVALYASGIYSDATTINLKLSVAPIASMIFIVQSGILLREGSVLPAGYSADAQSPFIGSEYGAQLIWQVVSDFYFTVSGGVFLPNILDAYPADAPPEWKAMLTCGLKL